MATCPRCGTALKDEYGMSQCPACGAFSFIDMDGNAVIQQEEVQPEEEQATANDSSSASSNLDSHYNEVSHATAGGAAAPPDFSDPIESLIDVGAGDVAAPDSGETDGFGSDFKPFDPFESPEPFEQTPSSDSQPFDAAPVSSDNEEPSFGPANDPLNLNEFANSEISAAKDGPLLFRVLISGIDTREIRESIREVLEDSRFAWDSNEIFSKVSKGHLAIDGLSPVKASILITRIKRLPVEIRWEQYAIAQGQL